MRFGIFSLLMLFFAVDASAQFKGDLTRDGVSRRGYFRDLTKPDCRSYPNKPYDAPKAICWFNTLEGMPEEFRIRAGDPNMGPNGGGEPQYRIIRVSGRLLFGGKKGVKDVKLDRLVVSGNDGIR